MKYLKNFNEELKSTTYKSAADSLKHNHPTRANSLDKFGDIRFAQEQEELKKIEAELEKKKKEEKYKEYQDEIKRYSPFGLFTFNIKPDNELDFTEDFYLMVTHWYDQGHHGDIEPNTETYLNLDFHIIPKDIEVYEKVSNCGTWDWQDGYRFHIDRGYIKIDLKENYCKVLGFIKDNADNFSGKIEIADRKTALKFKRLLVSIFSNKDYPDFIENNYETYPSLYDSIEATLAESGLSADFGLEMKTIAENINKDSVNLFYQSN